MESHRREGSLRVKTKGSFDSNEFLILIIGNLSNNEKRLKITKKCRKRKIQITLWGDLAESITEDVCMDRSKSTILIITSTTVKSFMSKNIYVII